MQHDFILLDRSGSMSDRWKETLSALNSYVSDLVEKNVDTGVTLALFDEHGGESTFDVVRDRIIPATWKPVTEQEVKPRGYTPLNDAIGKLVTRAQAGLNGVQYDKVVLIIITDGHENASREYTHTQAKALLDSCRTKGWQVIFLGADFDNAVQAASYGNASAATLSVGKAKLDTAFRSMALKRAAFGASGQSMSYSAEEKPDFNK